MTYPGNTPIALEMDEFWRESQALWQQWQYQADLDTKMLTGQQDYYNNYLPINQRNQRQLHFNKILRIGNMIGGYQRDNRLQNVVIAGDNTPDAGKTADQRSKTMNWVMNQDKMYDKVSDSFDGSNTTGLNLGSFWMDFREDPENGEIKFERLPFSSFIMDNFWTKMDLSDCNRIWTRKYLTKRQLKSLIPGIEKEFPALGKGMSTKDGKFQFLAQNWNLYQQDYYAYDEYWVVDSKRTRKILDRATGEVIPWNGTREQFQMFKQFNPNIQVISATVPTVKLHVLINNQEIYEEKSPYGLNRLPFVPFVCYHFPEVQDYAFRYQGIVRNIRDSQVELNKRRNRLLDIMDAQVQSGLMVKEDALVNPEDAFLSGPGKVLFFKNSANLASDVAPIPPPPVAQGWMELIASIEKEIMDIVGPEELFAQNMNSKDMTSVLMKLKMGAGLTGLRNIFDRLNHSQMMMGEIIDDLIVENFSQGKVAKILGEQPSEMFFDREYTKYSCIVEEAELTSTQRQLKFLQAVQLKQIIPDSISDAYLLEQSTLSGKSELVEQAKQKAEMAQQMQQIQMQQEMQKNEILTRSIEAKAQNDFASAHERHARATSDIALAKERTSQSVHDRAAAALDNSRALKELDQMDENRLIKLSHFILDLQQRQKELAGGEEGDAKQTSDEVGNPVTEAELKTRPSNSEQQPQMQQA